MWGLSPVAASRGHSSSRCEGLSLSWPLLLRSTGSRCAGSVAVAHGPKLLRGMWDPPRPGLEPTSAAPAGGLPTTAPPGKPWSWFLCKYSWEQNPEFWHAHDSLPTAFVLGGQYGCIWHSWLPLFFLEYLEHVYPCLLEWSNTLKICNFFFFLASSGLCCCTWVFSSCGERGLLFIAVCRLLIAVASLVAEHRL